MTPFADFYRREYPAAVRLAGLLTRSGAAADDVVQDAMATVYARYEDLDNPGGYLRVTVVNACRRWHRSNERESRRLRLVGMAEPAVPEIEVMTDALARLPHRQRSVLVLRYWAGLSEREIAETLGCRPGTVKSLASRALATLRKEVHR